MCQENQLTNYLSIEVEDWFQVTNYAVVVSQSQWDRMEFRLDRSVDKVLKILEESDVKATFFVSGWIADRSPEVVKSIVEKEHEIASHGYGHDLLYNIGPDEFKHDLLRGMESISSITGSDVIGYRAPSFTITNETEWAFSILSEVGIRYDSSVYTMKRRRCGISGAPLMPYDIETPTGLIREFPIATLQLGRFRFPVGGGGYFRLYPYWVTSLALRTLNLRSIPFVFYIHLWEFDPDQPVPVGVAYHQRWKHRVNLKHTDTKFRKLCNEFNFKPLYMGLDSNL